MSVTDTALEHAFNSIDEDGSGFIDPDEVPARARARPPICALIRAAVCPRAVTSALHRWQPRATGSAARARGARAPTASVLCARVLPSLSLSPTPPHPAPRQPCGLTDPARAQFKALCLKLDESMTDDAIDEVRARIYTCSFFCRLRREVLCRGRERPTPSLHAT